MTVDLRERLRRVLGPTAPPRPVQQVTQPRRGPNVEDLVEGRVVETDAGACFVAERWYGLDHVHGAERISGFLELADRAIACLARDPVAARPHRSEFLFLDTETTGLSGGTGTYVFMVGVGFFEGDRFVIRQYFMRHHAEELAMLALLDALFPRFRAVVTFNGKAFDLPLLATRFVASRRRLSLQPTLHLDLLFPSRRFWRQRLESCALGTLERGILGHVRHRDVPSWVIPELYFQYVRGGDARSIAGLFDHNEHDILSLVALAARMGRLIGQPTSTEADAEDLVSVARMFEDLGFLQDGRDCYERALALPAPRAFRMATAQRLAMICKRTGRTARAVELWNGLVQAGCASADPYVELAKHHEHRARDFTAAIDVVEHALTRLDLTAARGGPVAGCERAELERRRARLLWKRGRAASPRLSSRACEGSSRVRS